MSPVPRHPDLPGFHYVKGVHWMVLAGAVADRLVADKQGRVHVVRPGWRPRNVTWAAMSLLGRGLIEEWNPEEMVWATEQGRAYLNRKFPGGHPDFVAVMLDKAIADAAAAASGQQAQDTNDEPDPRTVEDQQPVDPQMEMAQ